MPKYPYSIRPLKQSSEINLQTQKAINTGILLRSPHIADSSIEFGLRKKIHSLKTENHNTSVIGVLSQRLSNVEKELHTIKDELKVANNLLEEKDNEIKRLKARLSGEIKNELVCNAASDDKKNGNSNHNGKSKVNGNSNHNGKSKVNGNSSHNGQSKRVSDKDSIGSFNDEDESKKITSSFSMKNFHDESPTSPKSQSGSPTKKVSPPMKKKNKRIKESIKTSFDEKGQRDSSPANLVVLRPGEKKPEYKKFRDNQISDVETPENQSPTGSDPKISQLEQENQQLAQKVAELEKFIGEYGLMWVGDKAMGDGHKEPRPGTSATAPSRSTQLKAKTTVKIKRPDLDNVITVISDLNETVSEQHIVKSPLGAKFQLKLYADGMQLEQNPFRKYDTPSAEAFFKDLEDGYYPSELKSKHPQGVIFKVIDKRNIAYEEDTVESKPKPFSGKGVRLGGEGKKTSLTRRDSKVSVRSKVPKKASATSIKPKISPILPDKVSISSKKSRRVSYEEINEPPKPKMKIKKKIPKNEHISEESDRSGFREHWVSRKSPQPSVSGVYEKFDENPPRIDMPSIPMEINLTQSRDPSPPTVSSPKVPPSSFTPAVSLNASKPHPPQKEPAPIPEEPQSIPQQPTASRVFSDQAIYQENDQNKRAPINITNITYHEAPVTFQLTPEDAATIPKVAAAASRPMPRQTSCKCSHGHSHTHISRSYNEICPGVCGQFGVIGVPKKPVMCPCGCGARANLHIHEAPPAHEMDNLLESRDDKDDEKQDFNLTERKLDLLAKMKLVYHYDQLTKMHAFACILPQGPDEPLEPLPQRPFHGMTEYQDKISKMAFMRMHHGKEINDAVEGTPAAGKPSGFKNVKVDPNEKFEHFTYMGKARGDKAAGETGGFHGAKRKSETAKNYDVLELNKKTSETMISVRLHSDIKKKTYLIHLYPGDPVEKIWSILNTSGENYEMVTQIGDKPVLLLDDATLEEQNIKDHADITVRRSPNKEKKKSLETAQDVDKVKEEPQIVSKRKKPEKKTSGVSEVSEDNSVESEVETNKKSKKRTKLDKKETINPNDLPPLQVVSDTSNSPPETTKSPTRRKAEEMLEDKYEEFLAQKSKTSTPKKLSKDDEKDDKKAMMDIKNSSRKVSSEPLVDKQVYDEHLSSSVIGSGSPDKTPKETSPMTPTSVKSVTSRTRNVSGNSEENVTQKNLTDGVKSQKDDAPDKRSQEKSASPKKTPSPGSPKQIDDKTELAKRSQEKSVSPKKAPSPGSPKQLDDKTELAKRSQEKSVSPKKAPSPGSPKQLDDKIELAKRSQEKSISPKKAPSPGSPKQVDDKTEVAKRSQEKSVSPKKAPSPGSPKQLDDKTDVAKRSQEKSVSPKKAPSPGSPKQLDDKTEIAKRSQEKSVSPKKARSPVSPKQLDDKTDVAIRSQEKSVSPKKAPSPESPKQVDDKTEIVKKSQEKSVSPKKAPSPESPKQIDDKTEPKEKSASPQKAPSRESQKQFDNKNEPTATESARRSQEKSVSPKKAPSPESPEQLKSPQDKEDSSKKIDEKSAENKKEKSISPTKPPNSPKSRSEKSSPIKETKNQDVPEQKSPSKSKSSSPNIEKPQIAPEISV